MIIIIGDMYSGLIGDFLICSWVFYYWVIYIILIVVFVLIL